MKKVISTNGSLFYESSFLRETSELYQTLMEGINWRQDEIKVFGKTYLTPRLHAWYADEGADYSYSGIQLERNDWTKPLNLLRERLREETALDFNGVLLNWYRSGLDSNGWHSDDEAELLRPIEIASVTLGAEREFQLREKGETRIKESLRLEDGSLVVMRSPFQEFWQHCIPKRKRVDEGRINLTFRQIRLDG